MGGPSSTESEGSSLFLSGVLRSIVYACARRPWTTLLIVALTSLASVAWTVTHLHFKTDRSDLIDPSTPFHQRWLRYTESFGASSDMIVVVEAEKPELIKQTLDALGSRLRQEPELFSNVLYKIEAGRLRNKGLQYLPPDSLVGGLEHLEEYRPILQGRWELVRLESLIPLLEYQLRDLSGDTPPENSPLWQHALRLTDSLARFAADHNDFVNPWPDILPVDPTLVDQGNQTVYTMNEAGTMGFLMATPVKSNDNFEGATQAIDRMRKIIAEVERERPKSDILLTGIPVLENDEMRRSQEDSSRAAVISTIGVALLFLLGFRGWRHPALGMITLGVGMAWSFGFTTLVIGHLNILSVAFASIVIGLGNDFAVHLLSRYLDRRHHGRDSRRALVEASATVGPGIVTGAITTALAFFCAAFTSFLGVAELGIIAGGGLILCTIATFTCLPALVAIMDRHTGEKTLPVPIQGRALSDLTSRFPLPVVAATIVLFAGVGWAACSWDQGWPRPRLTYDHNLLHLQAEGLESVEAQDRIFKSSNNSLLFAISLANSAEQAREMKARFEALPTVRHVEELATRLPKHPASESQLLVQGFHAYLSHLPEKPPPPTPANPAQVGQMLDDFDRSLRDNPLPVAKTISANIDRFLDQLDQLDLRAQMELLGEFQYRLAYALLAQFQAIAQAADPAPVSIHDLPQELTARYVSPKGKWLLQVFPRDQVWDMEPLAEFVHDVRTVDPEVTGTPLQNFEAAQQIKESYEICAIYSLVVILLILLMDFLPKEEVPTIFGLPAIALGIAAVIVAFSQAHLPLVTWLYAYVAGTFLLALWRDRGAVLETLVGIIPPILGLLLTFGILSILNISLNPANLIILPLIIGIGVDNGVHVLHDFHSRGTGRYRLSPSLVNAVAMTTSTSIVGFGSMMISAHRGLSSLGIVLSIGVASCLVLALITLPAVLTLVARRREAGDDSLQTPDSGENQSSGHDLEMPQESSLPADEEHPDILPLPKVPRVA